MRRNPTLALWGALCLSVCGCGTTRAYDGPERPAAEVAHVECVRAGGTGPLNFVIPTTSSDPYELVRPVVERVDSRDIGSATVDMLPGVRELILAAEDQEGIVNLGGRLSVDVQAGKRYEVLVARGTKVQHVMGIREAGASVWLATTERPLEAYCPIDAAEWLAGYEPVDSADERTRVFVTWIPQGKTLADSDEMLEVFRMPRSMSESLYPENPAWRERWQEELPLHWHERKPLAWGKDWMAFTYSGDSAPKKVMRYGVGVYRIAGEMQYMMYFERLGAAPEPGDVELWKKRLLEVALR